MWKEIKISFQLLPIYIKCILIGTFIAGLGLFMNWYIVIDEFERQSSYSALTGPTFLAGYTLLFIITYSFLAMLKALKNQGCELTLLKKYYVEKWSGVIITYLSIIIISFYLSGVHPSSTDKNIGLGFFITLTGGLIILFGSVLFKSKTAKYFKETQQLEFDDIKLNFKTQEIIDELNIDEHNLIHQAQRKKQKEIANKIHNI